METAALRIGCKVNLTLRITGVRPNGWHELDTVFLPLAEPSDTLRLALRPGGGLALHCAEPGIDPENNTLTKAYRLFAEASGFRPGVEAVLEKGIPHGAGLGGGSADAAVLRTRISELRAAARAAQDREEAERLKRRIAELQVLRRQSSELAELTKRYYERNYNRDERYTL